MIIYTLFGNESIVPQHIIIVNRRQRMKTQRNILIAFILNLSFAVFELFGGVFTGSVAILSDAVHDLGDAASIGLAWFLEKKSRQKPNKHYTFGYGRFSVLGSLITTSILLIGSVVMICHAVNRIISPSQIHYNGMILFAIIGAIVNFAAAMFTHGGTSLNQKAVNLHLLEDVLGWIVVLIGAVVMRFTDFALLDPLLSMGVSLFILIHAVINLKQAMELFLEKAPNDTNAHAIKEIILSVAGVQDVHHIHLWSLDGENSSATMHIVTECEPAHIKKQVRNKLREAGICHCTLELESPDEMCRDKTCIPGHATCSTHCHHSHSHRFGKF